PDSAAYGRPLLPDPGIARPGSGPEVRGTGRRLVVQTGPHPMKKPIRRLRWWIGGLLFASTVINYIDRQTLSVLAPFLKQEYQWSNTDFATVLIAFRLAYTIMQGVGGRLLDWLGTRRGLSLTVIFYSTVACLTSLAQGLTGFRVFRFLLGVGEGPN